MTKVTSSRRRDRDVDFDAGRVTPDFAKPLPAPTDASGAGAPEPEGVSLADEDRREDEPEEAFWDVAVSDGARRSESFFDGGPAAGSADVDAPSRPFADAAPPPPPRRPSLLGALFCVCSAEEEAEAGARARSR